MIGLDPKKLFGSALISDRCNNIILGANCQYALRLEFELGNHQTMVRVMVSRIKNTFRLSGNSLV